LYCDFDYLDNEVQIIYFHFFPHRKDSLSPLQRKAGQICHGNNQSFTENHTRTIKYGFQLKHIFLMLVQVVKDGNLFALQD